MQNSNVVSLFKKREKKSRRADIEKIVELFKNTEEGEICSFTKITQAIGLHKGGGDYRIQKALEISLQNEIVMCNVHGEGYIRVSKIQNIYKIADDLKKQTKLLEKGNLALRGAFKDLDELDHPNYLYGLLDTNREIRKDLEQLELKCERGFEVLDKRKAMELWLAYEELYRRVKINSHYFHQQEIWLSRCCDGLDEIINAK